MQQLVHLFSLFPDSAFCTKCIQKTTPSICVSQPDPRNLFRADTTEREKNKQMWEKIQLDEAYGTHTVGWLLVNFIIQKKKTRMMK